MPRFSEIGYNPSQTPIPGTLQVGDLAVGISPQAYCDRPGDITYWMSPDQDLGFVIACPVPSQDKQTPVGNIGSVRFWRTKTKTDAEFVALVRYVSSKYNGDPVTDVESAVTWLSSVGFWTSYVSGPSTANLILYWDLQNSSSYSGTGNTVTDLQGNINGTLFGTVSYSAGSPNYLTVEGGPSEYIITATGLNSYLSPPDTGTAISYFLWIYPTENGVVVSEIGQTTVNTGWHDSQIEIVSGVLKFRLWNGSEVISNMPLVLNTWHYIGLAYNGSVLKTYLNGTEVGSQTMSRLTPYNNGGSLNLFYALGPDDFTDLGDGSGATFRFGAFHVYNVGLTAGDVLSNYNSTKSSYPAIPVFRNLVAFYDPGRVDSYPGSGTTLFSLVTPKYNAVLNNSPTYSSNQGAFVFNGSNQYISLAHNSNLKPTSGLTTEQWIRADNWNDGVSGNYRCSLSCTQGGGYSNNIWSGNFYAYLYVSGAYRINSVDVSSFTGWHHFVTTFDGRYVLLYVDGSLVDSVDLGSSGNTVSYDNDNSIMIGAEASGTTSPEGFYWDGEISVLRIYNAALSSGEILQNFNESKARFGF